jgi:hypothetical protein
MTKDFRHVGKIADTTPATSQSATTPAPSKAPQGSEVNRNIVIFALQGGATLFLLGGLWLLAGQSSPFPTPVSRLIGAALLVAGVTDFAVAAIIKRRWAQTPTKNQG